MARKLLGIVFALVIMSVFVVGCAREEVQDDAVVTAPAPGTNVADINETVVINDELSDVDELDQDLDISELESIDQDLADIESLFE